MPPLSSSRKGDYTATPIVGQIRNYNSLNLKLSKHEVDSVFLGIVIFCTKSFSYSTSNLILVSLATLSDANNHGYTQFRHVQQII